MDLVDETLAKERIRGYVDSREWWIIPYLSDLSADVAEAIEETYYTGDASGDFHAILAPVFPPGFLSFARKRRMSGVELGAVIAKFRGGPTVEIPAGQDIVLPVDADNFTEELADITARMLAFERWLRS